MRRWIWLLLILVGSFPAIAAENTIMEIDVRGMICAFCVEGLHKSLVRLPGIRGADVSLKYSLVRIELDPENEPTLGVIKQTIVDAGFTPGDVREIS